MKEKIKEISKGKYNLSQEKVRKMGRLIYDMHNGDIDQISRFCMMILQTTLDMKGSDKLEIISRNEKTGKTTKLTIETTI